MLASIFKYLFVTDYPQNIVVETTMLNNPDAIPPPSETEYITGVITHSTDIKKAIGCKEFNHDLYLFSDSKDVLDEAITQLESYSYDSCSHEVLNADVIRADLITAITQTLTVASVSSTENLIRFGSTGAFGYANGMGNVSESIYYRNAIIFPVKKGIKNLHFVGKYGSQINTVNERTFEVKVGYVPYLDVGEYAEDQSYFDAILSNTQIYTFNKTFTTGVKYDLDFEKTFATDENTNNYGYGVIVIQDVSVTYETQPMYLRDSFVVTYYDFEDYQDSHLDETFSEICPYYIGILEKYRGSDNSSLIKIKARYEM
jgi:hypothetical protein